MKDSLETMDSEQLIARLTAALADKERELENRPNITKQQADGLFQWTADVLEATGTSDGEAALAAFDRLRDRLAAAERERDGWKSAAVEANNIQNRLGAGNLCLAHDLQTAEARVTTLTEALEKAREALELAGDFIQRERDLRDEGAFDEQDEYIAEPQRLCEAASATIAAIDAALKGEG